MKRLTIVLTDEAATAVMGLLTPNDVQSFISDNVEEKPPTGKHTRRVKVDGIDIRQHLARHFPIGSVFTTYRACAYIKSLGYSPNSASSALSELFDAGFVAHSKLGNYQFVKPLPADYQTPKKANTNGKVA